MEFNQKRFETQSSDDSSESENNTYQEEEEIDQDLQMTQEQLEKKTMKIVKEAIEDIEDNCFTEKDKFYMIQDDHQFYSNGKTHKIKYNSIRPKLSPYNNLKRYLHAGIVYAFSKGEEKLEDQEEISWKEIKYHKEYFEEQESKICSNCKLAYKEIAKEVKQLAVKRADFIKILNKQQKNTQQVDLNDSKAYYSTNNENNNNNNIIKNNNSSLVMNQNLSYYESNNNFMLKKNNN